MSKMKKLDGKVAIVTGGSKGIGKAISLRLAHEGAHVAVFARQESAAHDTAEAVRAAGTRAMFCKVDITRKEDVRQAVAEVLREFGQIDILVNNAGALKRTPLVEISAEEWQEIVGVNLTGTFLCIQAVVPSMIARAQGKIVNISSLSGKRGSAYLAHYSAAKAGVIALTQAAARELMEHGIYVNAIASGRVLTELSLKLEGTDGERWKKESLLGRLAEADEIAKVVVFLASDDSSYVVGETINVNGGVYLD
jgi:3-oxoacyl-[acyl-carrier protein] reductase